MTIAILWILSVVATAVVSYFVMRNNPKFFNLNKMAKEELQGLLDKIRAKL